MLYCPQKDRGDVGTHYKSTRKEHSEAGVIGAFCILRVALGTTNAGGK